MLLASLRHYTNVSFHAAEHPPLLQSQQPWDPLISQPSSYSPHPPPSPVKQSATPPRPRVDVHEGPLSADASVTMAVTTSLVNSGHVSNDQWSKDAVSGYGENLSSMSTAEPVPLAIPPTESGRFVSLSTQGDSLPLTGSSSVHASSVPDDDARPSTPTASPGASTIRRMLLQKARTLSALPDGRNASMLSDDNDPSRSLSYDLNISTPLRNADTILRAGEQAEDGNGMSFRDGGSSMRSSSRISPSALLSHQSDARGGVGSIGLGHSGRMHYHGVEDLPGVLDQPFSPSVSQYGTLSTSRNNSLVLASPISRTSVPSLSHSPRSLGSNSYGSATIRSFDKLSVSSPHSYPSIRDETWAWIRSEGEPEANKIKEQENYAGNYDYQGYNSNILRIDRSDRDLESYVHGYEERKTESGAWEQLHWESNRSISSEGEVGSRAIMPPLFRASNRTSQSVYSPLALNTDAAELSSTHSRASSRAFDNSRTHSRSTTANVSGEC